MDADDEQEDAEPDDEGEKVAEIFRHFGVRPADL